MPQFGIVVHGGAGIILREKMTPDLEAGFRAGLTDAITSGYTILEKGGSSLDAVQCAVNSMENNPLFNAGKGAVFTSSGGHQMDASIMDGRTLEAGAVAAVQHVKNPITLARMVMEKSPHVLLVGDGAEQFARRHGIELADDDYFHTQRRWEQLLEAKAEEEKKTGQPSEMPVKPKSLGTVGAVALDRNGNLAAATSTGGMSNSRYGRVGDSPIIGAGTYANNKTCAVSTTGHGEYLMRSVIAFDLSALMEYGGLSLAQAADKVIHGTFAEMGGTGGLIAINRQGEICLPFNTPGMYRGHLLDGFKIDVAIFKAPVLA